MTSGDDALAGHRLNRGAREPSTAGLHPSTVRKTAVDLRREAAQRRGVKLNTPRALRLLAAGSTLAIFWLPQLAAHAQPLPQADVPPELRAWIPWALDTAPNYGCTIGDAATGNDANILEADPICVWPGELTLTVGATEATFALDATSDRRTALGLPGGGRNWPVEVRVDGQPAVVLVQEGKPVLWLAAGVHRVEGRLPWATIPETLAVPDDIARVTLVRDGQASLPSRATAGEVWLRGGATAATEQDQVGLEVHRRIDDGSPVSVTTRIVVRAAGRARELRLPNVLPAGLVPIEISADLPVRLLASGELTLQLRPGTFTITLRALSAHPDASFRRPQVDAPWPDQEVWVWSPNEAFRQVELAGAPGIDPQRTSLPDEWRGLSAYLVDRTATLTLRTVRRGEPTPPPNQLGITREIWLDVAGNGYTARDALAVEMHSTHRLELAEGVLGRVSVAEHDQLITRRGSGRPGIEVRDTTQPFTAEWRGEARPSTLPAVNWSENASSVYTTLHLPPGWTLVHASGVDRAPGTWLERWTLLGVFALLLIAAAIGRVYGLGWGAVAFVGVGLGFHEAEAPQWLWLVLATLAGLHAALRGKRFEWVVRWTYWGAGIIATLFVVLFATTQLRVALYPQLAEMGNQSAVVEQSDWSLTRSEAPASAAVDGRTGISRYGIRGASDDGGLGGDSRNLAENAYWLDPNAVVQTGFGVPTWSWSSYTLAFDGPVARGHEIRLFLLPPWAFRLVAFLRAALVLLLLGVLIWKRPRPQAPAAPAPEPSAPAATAVAVAAGLLLASLAPSFAHAQATPSPELLTELQARLTRRSACGERCSEANRMRITVSGEVLRIELEIAAAEPAAYPLPGPSETWSPSLVTLDGTPTRALIRLQNGFIHVRVPAGAHVVRVEGPLTGRDSLTLAFGRAPRSLTVDAQGFEVDGLGTDDRVAESIQLRRTLDTAPGGEDEARSELPAWLEVRRRVDVGVRWTVETVVTRRSPANAPAVARIPLLPSESVTDANVVIENGAAVVTLGQRDSELRWTSVLTPSDAITLRAPTEGRVTEVWTLACSPLWHCETQAVPGHALLAPTEQGAAGTWQPTFHPWPGESLRIALTRPTAAPGQSQTIDSATLRVSPGIRLTSSSLTAAVRSSVSAPFYVTLPRDVELQSLTVDGQARPIQLAGGRVAVALQPGSHTVDLAWQSSTGWQTVFSTPRVTLGSAAVNVTLDVPLSSDRWVLWLSGPSWGPAVLFWPYLALILALAIALARSAGPKLGIPLRMHDWILLLFGLTQVPAVAALVVVGWFYLVAVRRRDTTLHFLLFDLRQLAIVFYTMLAFGCLVWAVESGLLGDPAMDLSGPNCSATQAEFFVDRIDRALPVATVLSLPIWAYRVLMFAWALWLAVSLIRWARWGWGAFRHEGLLRTRLTQPRTPPP
jgi:hypothetical protein